jgi:hypothetical protein
MGRCSNFVDDLPTVLVFRPLGQRHSVTVEGRGLNQLPLVLLRPVADHLGRLTRAKRDGLGDALEDPSDMQSRSFCRQSIVAFTLNGLRQRPLGGRTDEECHCHDLSSLLEIGKFPSTILGA